MAKLAHFDIIATSFQPRWSTGVIWWP